MPSQAARRTSLWMATGSVPQPGPLSRDIQVDVCVIGAGIAGLTTAYHLAKEGKLVAVLDDGPVAGGNTQFSTAHLSAVLDVPYRRLERLHGRLGARGAAASHAAAITRIEEICHEEEIHCDFTRVDGFLFNPPGDSSDELDLELEAAIRAQVWGVEKVAKAPLEHFDTGACLRFPGQAQFHPLRYAAGLVRAILREGGLIFTETHATAIEGPEGRVYTGAGPVVTAEQIVVATNSPVDDRFVIHSKQAAYLSYVIGALVPRGSVARALYWDTAEPYHYARLQPLSPSHVWNGDHGPGNHEVLLVGGEDHRTGQVNDQSERYERLETWARKRFPMIESVRFRWSGQIMESVDGLGYIGRNPLDASNVYVATGDSGNGMTHGTLAGMILTDLIMGRDNQWSGLYDPSRKTLKAAGLVLREGLNAVKQYAGWLTDGDVTSAEKLSPDTGAVIRRGVTKIAVYRDPRGVLHQRSAICPHLGSIVVWNQAERTFDAPCFGSRFDCFGRVINGPANRDLARVWDLEAKEAQTQRPSRSREPVLAQLSEAAASLRTTMSW